MSKVIINGIKDCHARGLDSVVLGQENGKLRRAFIAHPHHDLWWENDLISVGFHPHHCDITLEVVQGAIVNLNLEVGGNTASDYQLGNLSTFLYHSPIMKGGQGSFELLSGPQEYGIEEVKLAEGDVYSLKANAVHTIYIPKGQPAIWIVSEGEEDPEYCPKVYSNRDLRGEKLEGMYRPMEASEVEEAVKRIQALLRTPPFELTNSTSLR